MAFDALATSVRYELDTLRDEFERAWKAGQRPRIEEYLSARTEPQRTWLFQTLLEVEVSLRKTSGDRPESRDYLERFEPFTEVIHTVLADSGPGDPTRTDSPHRTEPAADRARPEHFDTTLSAPPGDAGASADSVNEMVPETIGRYRVIRSLGRGNFQVYLARDERDCRDVAIKVARTDRPRGVERLMSLAAEAETLKSLEHARIVKLYEYVRPGEPGVGADGYIVLEYVEGCDGERTLEALFRRGPVPAPRLTRIATLVAEALHHAHTHASHLVHRDLKPSNILLDRSGEPRVCDFGLAIDDELQRLRRGEVAGTAPFMAPEQVRGETHLLDGRTDIWALGVILYRGLTGRLPFAGPGPEQIFDEILNRDPRPLRMVDPTIEPELERICLRCLSRRMSERYLTAADLADDLRRVLDEMRPEPTGAPERIVPKGLRPFDGQDARFFLALIPGPRRGDGMPESVRFWKDRVEATGGDKVFKVGVLYGPSGGGKSSFVRAGLLPNLDRGRVTPVYLEAAPSGTESRLFAELRRLAPAAPPSVSLPDAVAIAREDSARRTGTKLFLVLDQFEQWLQAHPDDPDAELVQALRQCDGRRVQAIVLVRDDFWMPVTRFLRAVDAPFAPGGNAAAVELFDARHARSVLEGFGKALGHVPEDGATGLGHASLFLDQAARDLTAPDGRVVPARLSLFIEVVRNRPWTPVTLRALGGVDGIGVKFLDECFASAPYKEHREAAQAVFRQLLPAPTSAIRARPKGAAELRAESGYQDRPGEFAELIRVLDRELWLIAAVNPDERAPARERLESTPAVPGEASYQLAHDYLVRPIRQWLEREQRSTRSGRARLRLTLVTASWLERSTSRQLPSPWEWASILRYIPSREWSTEERRLMSATARHYVSRALVAAVLFFGLAVGGKAWIDRSAARARLEQAVKADYRNLRAMIPGLEPDRAFLVRNLEAYERDQTPAHEREAAGVLLYRYEPTPERGRYLRDRVLAASGPDELELLRDALAVAPSHAGAGALWQTVGDPRAVPGQCLRAAAVLARLEPRHVRWQSAGVPVARALLAEDRRAMPRWVELLEPTALVLVPVLAQNCCDAEADSAARAQAADALAEILTRAQDAEELGRALVDSQPDAARILRRALASLPHPDAAVGFLRVVLEKGAADSDSGSEERKDLIAARSAEAAITLGVLGETDSLWPLLAHRPDPRLRARLIHTLADSGLAPQVLLDRLIRPGLDPSQKQAILLCVAEAREAGAAVPARAEFVKAASELYQHDPDPGVHSAAELLLRRLHRDDLLQAPPSRPSGQRDGPRRWMIGPNGHTFAILPGPLSYWMGSPKDVQGRLDNEQRHYRSINRSIAVATMEVTARQFRDFMRAKHNSDYEPDGRAAGDPTAVASKISWYDAAAYCNWLNELSAIPEDQWCYPKVVKSGENLGAGALAKTGYRLPTEAEWEYLCRAGTDTSRPSGGSDALLPRYAWTWLNSGDRPHPPGRLLPNAFGLFDTLGNVEEWCHDGPKDYRLKYQDDYPASTPQEPAPDTVPDVPKLHDDVWHYLRGGSFEESPLKARSAYRDEGPPDKSSLKIRWGFRVVRTLPRDLPSDSLPK